jgi:hypothetical protein
MSSDNATESGNNSTSDAAEIRLCSGRNCPNRGLNVSVHSCNRCKKAYYCDKHCQKSDWDAHKHRCFPSDSLHLTVPNFTVEAIQCAISNAQPGDVIALGTGTYCGQEALIINKPITLLGAGKSSTKICCNGLIIKDNSVTSESRNSVTIADFEILNSSKIENNKYKAVNVCGVRFSCPHEGRSDAVETGKQDNKILLLDCEMIGGCDGLCIGGDGVHLKRTLIQDARCRGIFSGHNSFTIEDSTIINCGGYGIKGRLGWIEKGKNRIQPGPWSNLGCAFSG